MSGAKEKQIKAGAVGALSISEEMCADVLFWIAESGRELSFSAPGPDLAWAAALIAHARDLLASELSKKN